MGDKNFSRAFKRIEGDDVESPIQELVFTAIEFILSLTPGLKLPIEQRDRLQFVHKKFLDSDLDIGVPQQRKDGKRALTGLALAKDVSSSSPLKVLELLNEVARDITEEDDELRFEFHYFRAESLMSIGHLNAAILDLEEASNVPPPTGKDWVKVDHKIGQCYSKLKEFEKAKSHLRKALEGLTNTDLAQSTKLVWQKTLKESIRKLDKKKQTAKDIETKQDLMPTQPNSTLPSLSVLVSVEHSETRGRFAVAAKDIACGTVLAVDDPLASILNPDQQKDMTKYCLRCITFCQQTFPCPTCSSVVYCSTNCREQDLPIHLYECELNLYQHRFVNGCDTFRIFLVLRIIFSYGSFAQVGQALKQKQGVFKMVNHADQRDQESDIKYLVLSSLLLRLLNRSSFSMSNILEIEALEIIYLLLQILDVNTHPLMSTDDCRISNSANSSGGKEVGLTRVGNAVNVDIGSIFNHSCNPNTCRINCGRKTIIIATRNIKKGEEVTDIYSMHYSEVPKETRQDWLLKNFFFNCNCQACSNDWPIYDHLPTLVNVEAMYKLREIERAISVALSKGDLDLASLLHFKDVSILEKEVDEPHILFVSLRNSLQFCLWRKYAQL